MKTKTKTKWGKQHGGARHVRVTPSTGQFTMRRPECLSTSVNSP